MVSKLKAHPPLDVKPGHCKGLLFGESGAGKTWLALRFPNPYYIDTEGGADLPHYMKRLQQSGGGYMGPEDGSCDFDVILDQLKALATEQHQYKTVVIDSATKIFQSAIAKEEERLGDKAVFGAQKKPAVARMRQIASWVDRLDMNVWFIAHEIPKWSGEGRERAQVGMEPDVWNKLIYELDLTLWIRKHGKGSRTATIYKTRLEGFPDGERFAVQENGVDVGFENFSSRYGGEAIQAAVTPIVLATPEQLAEIDRLLATIKIPEKDIEAMLTRANVEAWADLDTASATKAIAYFRKQVPQ